MKISFSGKACVRLLMKFPVNARAVIQTVILSLAAALSAVAFLFMINFLFSRTFVVFAARSKSYFVGASFVTVVGLSLLVGLLLQALSPKAAGSGIPEMKAAYWNELGYMPARPVLVKFIAGFLSVGGGSSLGREGPSVFIGAGVSSNLSGFLGAPRRERRGAAVIGASAGLAAAFNAPMAAVTFAIEEITGDFNSRFLGRVVLGSVIGALVVYALLGRQPAFALPAVENVSWLHYILVPPVALVASLAGVIFQRASLAWRERSKRMRRIPAWCRPAIGGFIAWAAGVSVFLISGKLGVFGLGYQDLSDALNNRLAWQVAGLLVAAKLVATIASYSFGGCGGIFAPLLFMGGLTGYFLSGLASLWLPVTPADRIVLSVVGMSCSLGAVVRAPLTSMLIVFEMTHQFTLVPGLLLGAIISQATARLAGRLNFYDALLVQDGHDLHKIRPPVDLQSWQRLPVSAIANPRPVVLRDLSREALRGIVDRYPFQSFPVEKEGKLLGLVTRQRILDAIREGGVPDVRPVVICHPDQTVQEIGDKFIASPANVLVVIDREAGDIRGIITLHDLIRAQASIQN